MESFESNFLLSIPHSIVVCSLNFDLDRGDLYVTRLEKGLQVVFKLPLTRQSTRNGEVDGLTFITANNLFEVIMKGNKQSTHTAKDCVSSQSRKDWFAERKSLDNGLKELLDKIEKCWLSGFKVLSCELIIGSFLNLGIQRCFYGTAFRSIQIAY